MERPLLAGGSAGEQAVLPGVAPRLLLLRRFSATEPRRANIWATGHRYWVHGLVAVGGQHWRREEGDPEAIAAAQAAVRAAGAVSPLMITATTGGVR